MQDSTMDFICAWIDEVQEKEGLILDLDHVDESLKTVYLSRLPETSLDHPEALRQALKEVESPYRVGSIIRHTL